MLVPGWGYSPSQVHSADPSRSTRNGATFRSIHLQIHLARRVPCQASAASNMGSVGNSAGANSSQGDLTTPLSPENHFRIQTRTALFRITPLIQDSWVLVGIVLVFTHIYPPFEISVCLWLTLWKLHCQFLGGGVTARTLVVERTLQQ